jgi:hypothetical protein
MGLGAAALILTAATPTPFIEPTLPPSPTAVCAPAPRSRLILRERARVSVEDPRPLNVRAAPGTTANVIAQIPAGGILYVLEGPQCSANYAWYRVEYQGIAGWVAEGDDSAYFVSEYPPG